MSDDKVTRLPVRPKDTGRPIILAPASACRHVRAIVDDKLAEVRCADCNEKLNPIAFLVTMANKLSAWEYYAEEHRRLQARNDERKQCRCLKCGQITPIRRVSNHELQRLRASQPKGDT